MVYMVYIIRSIWPSSVHLWEVMMASAKPGSIVSFASVCFQAATNLNDEKVRKIRNDTRTKKNTPIFGHKIFMFTDVPTFLLNF